MFNFSGLCTCVCVCMCAQMCVSRVFACGGNGAAVQVTVVRNFPGSRLSSFASSGEAPAFMGKSQRHLGWHSQGQRGSHWEQQPQSADTAGPFPVTLHKMPSTVRTRHEKWPRSADSGNYWSSFSHTVQIYREITAMHGCHLGSCQSEYQTWILFPNPPPDVLRYFTPI